MLIQFDLLNRVHIVLISQRHVSGNIELAGMDSNADIMFDDMFDDI